MLKWSEEVSTQERRVAWWETSEPEEDGKGINKGGKWVWMTETNIHTLRNEEHSVSEFEKKMALRRDILKWVSRDLSRLSLEWGDTNVCGNIIRVRRGHSVGGTGISKEEILGRDVRA